MGYSIERTGLRGNVLCQTEDSLIYYTKGKVVRHFLSDDRELKLDIPNPLVKRVASNIRLLDRIQHAEARWALSVEDRFFLLCSGKKLFRINNDFTDIIEEATFDKNPLGYCVLRGMPGFQARIIIGEYAGDINNPQIPNECNIWARGLDEDTKIKSIYLFEKGVITHIHSFFPDYNNGCVYITTGDEDSESGIWKTEDDFKTIKPVLIGSQQYRCCQMLIGNEGIYYLTDAPSERNHLYCFDGNKVEQIGDVVGSVIYGTVISDSLLFSTTVEPEAHGKNLADYWLSNKPGRGIIGNQFELNLLNRSGKIETLKQFKHDGLPLRLFQYGVFHFTNDVNGVAYATACCTRKHDYEIFRITISG